VYLFVDSAVRMEVIVPRQEQSNQCSEDMLKFSGRAKAFGNSKRKAEEFHECGGNEKPEPEGKGNTMGCLKEDTVSQENFGVSYERRFQEYHTHHTDTNSKGEKNVLECLEETPNLASKKRDGPKKIAASKKKRKLEDKLLLDELEQDEEMLFLLKTKNRSRAGRINNIMVTIFLAA